MIFKNIRKLQRKKLSENPSELETENGIEKEEISNTIRKEETENGETFY